MDRTTYNIKKMDCSAEEQLIRMRLAGLPGVEHLEFNIPERQLSVYHHGDSVAIDNALDSLALGASKIRNTERSVKGVEGAPNTDERGPLIAALAINAAFFVGEFVAGFLGHSMGLIADSLDMLADAFVYALSLAAVGGSALLKRRLAGYSGYLQFGLALFGLIEVGRRFVFSESMPDFTTMMVVASVALVANLATLILLSRTKRGEAHLEASWIFTSNDIKVNLLVIASGGIVWATASRIPDLLAGALIFLIVARGARQILALSRPPLDH